MLQKVLQPLFFAREDTKRPFYYALAALVVNAVVAVGLAPVIGYIAAAIGTTVAGWAMVFLLWRGARGMGEAATLDDRFRRRILGILGASAVMGGALALAARALAPWLSGGAERYAALAGLVLIGIAVYAVAGRVLGAVSIAELKGALKR